MDVSDDDSEEQEYLRTIGQLDEPVEPPSPPIRQQYAHVPEPSQNLSTYTHHQEYTKEKLVVDEYDSQLSEVEHRLAMGQCYRELINGCIFDNPNEIALLVEQEMKDFARKRLSVLFGLTVETPVSIRQFNDEEEMMLKSIAAQGLELARKKGKSVQVKPAIPKPSLLPRATPPPPMVTKPARPSLRRREMPDGAGPTAPIQPPPLVQYQPQPVYYQPPPPPAPIWNGQQWVFPNQPTQSPQLHYQSPPQYTPPQHQSAPVYPVQPILTQSLPSQNQPPNFPMDPSFIPPAGEVYRKNGKIIKIHWTKVPHPDLVAPGVQTVQTSNGLFKIVEQNITPRQKPVTPMPTQHQMGVISAMKSGQAVTMLDRGVTANDPFSEVTALHRSNQ